MGARTDQRCSICASNPDVLAAVNEILQNRTKTLDVLARESGFSRAALSRHSRKHILRYALRRNREQKINLAGKRVVTAWPEKFGPGGALYTTVATDPAGRESFRALAESELGPENDVFLEVVLEPAASAPVQAETERSEPMSISNEF